LGEAAPILHRANIEHGRDRNGGLAYLRGT
jgi:hypothetical protein